MKSEFLSRLCDLFSCSSDQNQLFDLSIKRIDPFIICRIFIISSTDQSADLGKTDLARGLYQDIEAGMINKMSWAFSVAEESYDRETHTRTILKIKKVYDVSAVSIPANGDTEISARAFASRSCENCSRRKRRRRRGRRQRTAESA